MCPGEEKLNILEIVKPVETVEVVIDPDAAGEEAALVEEGQLIAVERSALSDETSEQVTRWAAALEGYRKEQVRLGIPYGEQHFNKLFWFVLCDKYTWLLVYAFLFFLSLRPRALVSWPGDPLGRVGDEGV